MELRHLRYFMLVAEELHFGRAAERAGISQPPLSQQIRSLEGELGVDLFRRSGRRVELTEAGRALLPEARRVLQQAERAERVARAAATGQAGVLTVGFVGSLAYGLIGAFTRVHRSTVPEVMIDLRELTSEQQRDALLRREIDLGLVRYRLVDPMITCDYLGREPLVAAIPADNRLARSNGPIALTELADQSFIMFPRRFGPGLFDYVSNLCRGAGFQARIVQEAVNMGTILALVDAGIGVAVVPASVQVLGLQEVEFRNLLTGDGKQPTVPIYLARRSGDQSAVIERASGMLASILHESGHA